MKNEDISYKKLKEEVFSRINLIYCEDIPLNVLARVNEELDFIRKNNLSELFLVFDKVCRFLRDRNYYYDGIGDSFVAYVLGINKINPLDIASDYGRFTKRKKMNFNINIPSSAVNRVVNYIRKLVGDNRFFRRVGYLKNDLKKIGYIQNNVQKAKLDSLRKYPVGYSYYFIPDNIEVGHYSAIGEYNGEKSMDMDFRFLDSIFPVVDFRSPLIIDRLQKLQTVSKVPVDEIPLDDYEVSNCLYMDVPSNEVEDYKSLQHYNVRNNFDMTMKLTWNGDVESVFDLLKLRDGSLWRCRVLSYYYDTWYRTYGADIYFNIYLNQLIRYFNIKKKDLEKESDAVIELILDVIQKMKVHCLHFVYEREVWF